MRLFLYLAYAGAIGFVGITLLAQTGEPSAVWFMGMIQ